MAFKSMTVEKLYEIYRRWQSGYKISNIRKALCVDRKTIRSYINHFVEKGLTKGCEHNKDAILLKLEEIIVCHNKRKTKKAYAELNIYRDEIISYIKDANEPVKPKTAYEIIKEKYNIESSYSTYKRFIKANGILELRRNETIRIETPPGLETQIDYCRVGYFTEPKTSRRKVVYAFCGLLSFSRLPYIEFVYRQDEVSFASSHARMWDYYGGSTETIVLDNLKSGIIKPSLYDPVENKTYSELLQHYNTFADPARVRRPKDKGKVERLVPTARELFRKLKKLYPEATLTELNSRAGNWCRYVYGKRKHGTTGIEPLQAFEKDEKQKLGKLPEEKFDFPVWKEAKVHPDQFIQFEKKIYGLPSEYRGLFVWVRKSGNIVRIFHKSVLIKQYVIPKGYRAYDKNDFPAVLSEMMERGFPKYLLRQAREINPFVYQLLYQILKPHANLNARRAQSILNVVNKYRQHKHFETVIKQAVSERLFRAKELELKFENSMNESCENRNRVMTSSELGRSMIRPVSYYIN